MVRRRARKLDRLAKMVAAWRALETLPARNTRFDRDPVADFESLYFAARPDDNTSAFMTKNVWTCHLQRADLTVFPEMDIRAVNGISGDYGIIFGKTYPHTPLHLT